MNTRTSPQEVRRRLLASGSVKAGTACTGRASAQAVEARRHEAHLETPTTRAVAILQAAALRGAR